MAIQRMDNIGIVVEDLDSTVEFFTELGLRLEGRTFVEGEWAGRITGLGTQRVEIAMMVTPDGHSRLELSRFVEPPVVELSSAIPSTTKSGVLPVRKPPGPRIVID